MLKIRGFRLSRRFVKTFKWVTHKKPKSRSYQRLNPPCSFTKLTASRCGSWFNYLKYRAKSLGFPSCDSGYTRVVEEPLLTKPVSVPKGHLAVYVGDEDDDDAYRVLVPIIYFNHPLFVKLLKETEKVYGFCHPGGIQIPCKITEFEDLQTKIAATSHSKEWSIRRRR